MRISKFIAPLLAALMLTSCGQAEAAPSEETSSQVSQSDGNAAADFETERLAENNFDIDLTTLSPSMVYGQVYDMVYTSDNYVDKTVKMKGPFSYFLDPQTNQEYFAVLISDATACCSQGIEFVLDGDYKYPDDYPEIGTEITVCGNFNYYKEGANTYCQLTEARILEIAQ